MFNCSSCARLPLLYLVLTFAIGGCGSAAQSTVVSSETPSPANPSNYNAAPTATTGSETGPTTNGNSQPGFLARASNGALFLQWTRSGDSVIGSVVEAYLTQTGATQISHLYRAFTGVVSGSSVALKMSVGALDTPETWNGTLSGSDLTLSLPNQDGTLSTQYFHPSTIGAYTSEVASLQGSGEQAQQELASATATAGTSSTQVANDTCAVGQTALFSSAMMVVYGTTASSVCSLYTATRRYLLLSPDEITNDTTGSSTAKIVCQLPVRENQATVWDTGRLVLGTTMCERLKSGSYP
jgi:hypothetical protein